MTAENYILASLAGLLVGWIANLLSKSRFSFPINLFVGIFGACLLNFFMVSAEMIRSDFLPILWVSLLGAAGLLGMFHLSRAFERR